MEVGKVARELDWVEIELIEFCACGEREKKREKGEREMYMKMRHHSQ